MDEQTEKVMEEAKDAAMSSTQRTKNLRELFSHIPKNDKIKDIYLNSSKSYTPLIININWNDFHFEYWDYGDNKEFWLVTVQTTTQEQKDVYRFWFKKSGSAEIKASKTTYEAYPLPIKELLDLSGYRKNWFIVENTYMEQAIKKRDELFRVKANTDEKIKKYRKQVKEVLEKAPEPDQNDQDYWDKKKALEDSIIIPQVEESEEFQQKKTEIEGQTGKSQIEKNMEIHEAKKEVSKQSVKIMEETAIQTVKDRGEPKELALTKENIKNYLYKGKFPISDQEVVMFLALCHRQNLDPWVGDVHLIKYTENEPAQMVVGKYAFLKRAKEIKDYKGLEAGIIVEDKDGNEIFREGERKKATETLIGGYAKIEVEGMRSSYAEVSMEEYNKPTHRGWKNIPATMIRKVAIVHALREAFPAEFQGMYDESEMAHTRPDKEEEI